MQSYRTISSVCQRYYSSVVVLVQSSSAVRVSLYGAGGIVPIAGIVPVKFDRHDCNSL